MRIRSVRECGVTIYTFKPKCSQEWRWEYKTTLSFNDFYWDMLDRLYS